MKIEELLNKKNGQGEAEVNYNDIITELQSKRNTSQPDCEKAKKQLNPLEHDVFDPIKRPDKSVKVDPDDKEQENVTTIISTDGEEPKAGYRKEPVARIALAIQKLIVKRAVAFLFGNPVELNASPETDAQKVVLKAVKRVLFDVKAKSLNRKIARQVFSCTECAELWYPVEKKSLSYGFESKFKLRCAIFSPLLGDTLYPYFDESGDMVAFSRMYTQTDAKDVEHKFFETYTDKQHFLWESTSSGWELVEGYPRKIQIGKIPVVYASQEQVEWADVQVLIDRLEKLLSNFADTNDYHASPKIFVKGEIKGFSKKGEAGAILEGDEDSEAEYLAWQNAPEAVKLEIETLLKMIYTITQTPDISFDSVKGLGSISGVALKLLFMDAHLKVADKQEIFDEYMQRRINIIKAFVGNFNTKLASECEALEIEPKITPYMIEDEKAKIDLLTTANGGRPVVSQKRSAELAALSSDTDADFEQMQEEESRRNSFVIGEPMDA